DLVDETRGLHGDEVALGAHALHRHVVEVGVERPHRRLARDLVPAGPGGEELGDVVDLRALHGLQLEAMPAPQARRCSSLARAGSETTPRPWSIITASSWQPCGSPPPHAFSRMATAAFSSLARP